MPSSRSRRSAGARPGSAMFPKAVRDPTPVARPMATSWREPPAMTVMSAPKTISVMARVSAVEASSRRARFRVCSAGVSCCSWHCSRCWGACSSPREAPFREAASPPESCGVACLPQVEGKHAPVLLARGPRAKSGRFAGRAFPRCASCADRGPVAASSGPEGRAGAGRYGLPGRMQHRTSS